MLPYPDPIGLYPKGRSNVLFHAAQPLFPRKYGHTAVRLGTNNRRMGLKGAMLNRWRDKPVLHNQVGFFKSLIHIAFINLDVREHIRPFRGKSIGMQRYSIVGKIRVNDHRRICPGRLFRIKYGRQLLILHLDQLQCFLRPLNRCCGDRRHRLPHVANHISCQYRHILNPPGPRQLFRRILFGHYTTNTRYLFCRRSINAENFGMGVGAPQHLGMKHAGQLYIGAVFFLAQDLRSGVKPDNTFSNY